MAIRGAYRFTASYEGDPVIGTTTVWPCMCNLDGLH